MNREKRQPKANPDRMFNESDLLFINEFVQEKVDDIPIETNENYTRYFQDKYKKNSPVSVTTTQQVGVDIVPDQVPEQVPVPDKQPAGQVPDKQSDPVKVTTIRRRSKIYIDSKYRDKLLYPDASDMKISWGRTISNVISMKLNSLEFPNVVKVINSNTNKIYWINKEDEDLDIPYTVYTAEILEGSYKFTTFQTEVVNKVNIVKRHNNVPTSDNANPPFHLFQMDINSETDYVNFTSIIAKAAPANPITTISGDSLVLFKFPNHGFVDGELVHILGVRGTIGGVQSSKFISSFIIQIIDDNSFTFNIKDIFTSDANGGGSLVKVGRESPFKFLFGTYSNTFADLIGFKMEDSCDTIPVSNPIKTKSIPVQDVILGNRTQIVALNHGLIPGDIVYLNDFHVFPSVYPRSKGIFVIYETPSPDIIILDTYTETIIDISNASIDTKLFEMNFPNHGFNRIVEIRQVSTNLISITTLFPHGFNSGDSTRINNTNCTPNIDGYYRNIQVVDLDTFTISNPINVLTPNILPLEITIPGFYGILLSDLTFRLYNVIPFGGFTYDELNNKVFTIREIIDENTFIFYGIYGFSSNTQTGGGSDVRISSKLHGWSGSHNNSPNGILNKPVALSGDNYAFMCIPNVNSDTTSSNGPVKDIFAKLFITSSPGVVISNQFDPAEIEFITMISKLKELHFQIKSANNELLSFGGLDYSFGLDIIHEVTVEDNN